MVRKDKKQGTQRKREWRLEEQQGEKQVDFNFYMKHFQSPTSIVPITVHAQGRIN